MEKEKENNRGEANFYERDFSKIYRDILIFSFFRTSNVFADPQPVVRPVSHLSWSPSEQNRLAASYSFTEFETQSPDVNTDSYIWDIGIGKPSLNYRAITRVSSSVKRNRRARRVTAEICLKILFRTVTVINDMLR